MKNYTTEEILELYSNVVKNIIDIKPIGHHDIGRNHVYLLKTEKKNFILKLFFKKNKRINSIKTVELLEANNIKCPEILKIGIIDDTEYILYSFMEGEILENIEENISEDNLKEIYIKMGELLGKIHMIPVVNLFGAWNKTEENKDSVLTAKDQLNYNYKRFFKVINKSEHKEYEIIEKAYNYIDNNIKNMVSDKKAVLCHGDFSKRNILVTKVNSEYRIDSIIDFEHSKPGDLDLDLVDIYLPILERDKELAIALISGYNNYCIFDINIFNKKKKMYELLIGIAIASWALKKAPDYYLKGIDMMKNLLNE